MNYPIVQSKDNSYYLYRNFYREDSKSGTIFSDYENSKESVDNIIVYGHNMRDKSMFHNLRYYCSNEEYFKQNKYIEIETVEAKYAFEVFSTHIPDKEFCDLATKFKDKDEHREFISKFKSEIDVNTYDAILTLSTYSYAFNNARNFIHKKLIKFEKF